MSVRRIGIIMNGVTGRMGTNQHLYRSIAAIIKQGGVRSGAGGGGREEVIMPDPLLVGRDREKLRAVAAGAGLPDGTLKLSTDLATALADPNYVLYFDAQTTERRAEAVRQAIAAGKHVYCEKPTAGTAAEAWGLFAAAEKAGVKHGVVQDKLFLPGIVKLRGMIESGFFGRILSVRGEFGYWVFDGHAAPAQRPSWNYRKEDGGGIILDMLPHWRYLLDNLFGEVRRLSCVGATHISQRWDEQGKPYAATADDAAYVTFELSGKGAEAGGIIAQFNSSWCTRVRRDDLLTLHVDGTEGSAVAGLRECVKQGADETPRPVWNPDLEKGEDFYAGWKPVSGGVDMPENAFKAQWELFLRHVVWGEPFPWNLGEGAKGVELAELALRSWREGRWVDVG